MRVFRWLAVFGLFLALPTCAQSQAQPLPLVGGTESEELRTLRLAEEAMFRDTHLQTEQLGRVQVRALPSALSSQVTVRQTGSATDADLQWLENLNLPNLPVRWDERVIRYLHYFRDNPRGRRIIRGWLARLPRYEETIRTSLARHELPGDLVYVAMIESGFDPSARSSARAVGLWQFVRRTGEEFGLTVNHWVDLRRDPNLASEAAAQYLRQLHRRFGTWELALAAYNAGYGTVLRAIRKYNTNDFWRLSHFEAALPFETNLYVAKIMACAIVARNPARFGIGDLQTEAPIRTDTVRVPGGTTLRQIARTANSDVDSLRQLNPSLRRSRVPPGRTPFVIHLPHGTGDAFARRWARRRSARAVERARVLRFGQTLADLAREWGTSERRIRAANELSDQEEVEAGTRLMVPVGRRASGEPTPTEPPVVAVLPGLHQMEGRRRLFYRTIRRDRLDEIARFFEVELEALCAWNNLEPTASLQPGMFLQLFVSPTLNISRAVVLTPDAVRIVDVGSEEFFAYHEGQQGRVRFRYLVQEGDTLSTLATRFGTSRSSLARINQFSRRQSLEVGQEIVVYATPERAPQPAERVSDEPESEPSAIETAQEGIAAVPPTPDESARATSQPAPPEDTPADAPSNLEAEFPRNDPNEEHSD